MVAVNPYFDIFCLLRILFSFGHLNFHSLVSGVSISGSKLVRISIEIMKQNY